MWPGLQLAKLPAESMIADSARFAPVRHGNHICLRSPDRTPPSRATPWEGLQLRPDTAALWSRLSTRDGLARVRAQLWPVVQTAAAAALAWAISDTILGHESPVFAPV